MGEKHMDETKIEKLVKKFEKDMAKHDAYVNDFVLEASARNFSRGYRSAMRMIIAELKRL